MIKLYRVVTSFVLCLVILVSGITAVRYYSTVTMRPEVMICSENVKGSGFLVGPDRVITARHVLLAAMPEHFPVVIDATGATNQIKNILVYGNTDAVLLILEHPVTTKPRVDTIWKYSYPKAGEVLHYRGFPKGGAYGSLYREGTVMGISKDAILMSTSVEFGDSGSAVYDSHNRLVGIMVSRYGLFSTWAGILPVREFKDLVDNLERRN